LVVPLGANPVNPDSGQQLEELSFTPKVEFSIITTGTTQGGKSTSKVYRTDLHIKQVSPDRRYFYGRDATTYTEGSGSNGPLIFDKRHWDDQRAKYLERIQKAFDYHFPIWTGVKKARMSPPFSTWLWCGRQPLYKFDDPAGFSQSDVTAVFELLRDRTGH